MIKHVSLIFLLILFGEINAVFAQTAPSTVSLYKTFERSLVNNKAYTNKFTGVDLKCVYTSPSGKKTEFYGFFDGDGKGGGSSTSGNVWKTRFLPDEIGQWSYAWTWSDNSTGGQGTFQCVAENAGKGVLRAYENNPRWFAYNGKDPVWIKSYYESGSGVISQPFDWVTQNVYQTLINRGYNHFQVNWLLSMCCFTSHYTDGPDQTNTDLALYQDGKASTTMQLDVWKLMEQHVSWLNDRNVGLQMFLGFDGGQNGGPNWANLSAAEKDFYVKYAVARLAPYANIAGWNFTWEVDGNRDAYELGWAKLVMKYDVFNHLRSYEDENPKDNEFDRPEYNFAAIENHLIFSADKTLDRPYWTAAWTHHEACKSGYVTGKPVLMVEGNSLWRRYWQPKLGSTVNDMRQAAWGCATAGASFLWCGHQGTGVLTLKGADGFPFFNDKTNPYTPTAFEMDVLSDVMNKELMFHKMTPNDALLSGHDAHKTWCLAEQGEQYLVFSTAGSPFKVKLKAGTYQNNVWLDTKTGKTQSASASTISTDQSVSFTPPNTSTDWVLLVRKKSAEPTDCAGIINGTATSDNCGRCIGGTTGKTACVSAGEAETDACSYDGVLETKNAGFKGTSYINVDNAVGTKIKFFVTATASGSHTLSFRYANGGTADRPATILIDGTALPSNLNFPSTGAFTTYKAVDLALTLSSGTHSVELSSATADGLANIDQIGYVSTGVSKGSCDEVITNISEAQENQLLMIYPNPSQSIFHIKMSAPLDVEITDADGKTLKTYSKVSDLEFGSDLQPGVYFAKVQNKVYKFVKI